jgi:hypothetical protein
MKLKKTILCLLLTITSIYASAQDKWFMQKISDKISVNFPLEPKKINENSYAVKDADDVVYALTIVDLLKVTGLDAAAFTTQVKTQAFADEFMNGLIPTMPKYTFKAAQIITVKGMPAYRLVGRNEEAKNTIFMTAVFVDGIGHTLASLIADGKDTKRKDKYIAGEIYFYGK